MTCWYVYSKQFPTNMDSTQLDWKNRVSMESQVVFSSVYKMNHTPVLMKMLLYYYDFINKTSVAI